MKICGKCKSPKEANSDNFGSRKSSRDGLYTWCRECCKNNAATYRIVNDTKVKHDRNEWQRLNPTNARLNRGRWKEKNSDLHKEIQARYKRSPKSREYQRTRRQNNKPLLAAYKAAYKARKLRASPPWLTLDHVKEIHMKYIEAKRRTDFTGVKHHVDHIVPLQNDNVCGLHVPWNLNVIVASINIAKGNRLYN